MEQGQQSGGPLARRIQAVLPTPSQMGAKDMETQDLPLLTCDPGHAFVTQFPSFQRDRILPVTPQFLLRACFPGGGPLHAPSQCLPFLPHKPTPTPAPLELLQSRALVHGPLCPECPPVQAPDPRPVGLRISRMRVGMDVRGAVQGTPNMPPPTKTCSPPTPTSTDENIEHCFLWALSVERKPLARTESLLYAQVGAQPREPPSKRGPVSSSASRSVAAASGNR